MWYMWPQINNNQVQSTVVFFSLQRILGSLSFLSLFFLFSLFSFFFSPFLLHNGLHVWWKNGASSSRHCQFAHVRGCQESRYRCTCRLVFTKQCVFAWCSPTHALGVCTQPQPTYPSHGIPRNPHGTHGLNLNPAAPLPLKMCVFFKPT